MEVYVKHLFWAFGLFFSGVALIMMSWGRSEESEDASDAISLKRDLVDT